LHFEVNGVFAEILVCGTKGLCAMGIWHCCSQSIGYFIWDNWLEISIYEISSVDFGLANLHLDCHDDGSPAKL